MKNIKIYITAVLLLISYIAFGQRGHSINSNSIIKHIPKINNVIRPHPNPNNRNNNILVPRQPKTEIKKDRHNNDDRVNPKKNTSDDFKKGENSKGKKK